MNHCCWLQNQLRICSESPTSWLCSFSDQKVQILKSKTEAINQKTKNSESCSLVSHLGVYGDGSSWFLQPVTIQNKIQCIWIYIHLVDVRPLRDATLGNRPQGPVSKTSTICWSCLNKSRYRPQLNIYIFTCPVQIVQLQKKNNKSDKNPSTATQSRSGRLGRNNKKRKTLAVGSLTVKTERRSEALIGGELKPWQPSKLLANIWRMSTAWSLLQHRFKRLPYHNTPLHTHNHTHKHKLIVQSRRCLTLRRTNTTKPLFLAQRGNF